MSMTTFRREMFGLLTEAWQNDDWPSSPLLVAPNYQPEGRTFPAKDPGTSYLEIYMRSAQGDQVSLANHDGVRRWEDVGTLWVLCFGSDKDGNGLEKAEYLATMAAEAYQGATTEHCAWFRNVRKVNVGSSGGWYQINVLIDYEYDEVR